MYLLLNLSKLILLHIMPRRPFHLSMLLFSDKLPHVNANLAQSIRRPLWQVFLVSVILLDVAYHPLGEIVGHNRRSHFFH